MRLRGTCLESRPSILRPLRAITRHSINSDACCRFQVESTRKCLVFFVNKADQSKYSIRQCLLYGDDIVPKDVRRHSASEVESMILNRFSRGKTA